MEDGLRIAADIGGTFTDVALIRDNDTVATRKVASTPNDYAQGVVQGILELIAAEGLEPESIGEVLHACTVATNVILEGKGAKTALITTSGFRDVLEMRRIRVPRLYEPLYEKPPALAPRRWRFEVAERMDHLGQVITPLDEESVEETIDRIVAADVEAVAVCLLHSYANPAHERRIGEMLKDRLPDLFVSLSVDVLPEIREYERTSTTVINSYVGPPVKSYLMSLRERLNTARLPPEFFMMHSAGGIVDARTVISKPAQIVECGPAAGVIAARAVVLESGIQDAISFDMGGTTAKAALIEKGELLKSDDYEIGGGISLSSKLAKGGGYALKLPVIDISEVGAGGGSIVWRDRAGGLKVGPQSAGAHPGPVCYGLGGSEPTVTDANMVLGYLNPVALAGGAVPVDPGLSQKALTEGVAEPLGIDLDRAAYGVHELVSTIMTRAVKSVTTYRGRDPREFAMVAFGGNGGVHAVSLARALGVTDVVVPPFAGVLSALGLLTAQVETGTSIAFLRMVAEIDITELVSAYSQLAEKATHELGQTQDGVRQIRAADIRYQGQAFELTLPVDEAMLDQKVFSEQMRAQFDASHERMYGYRLETTPIEIVTLRVTVQLDTEPKTMPSYQAQGDPIETRRSVYFGPEWGRVETPIIDRANLSKTSRQGPLVIEEYEGTTIVPPDCAVCLDAKGNIKITVPLPQTPEAQR